jgi:hypothetical protein
MIFTDNTDVEHKNAMASVVHHHEKSFEDLEETKKMKRLRIKP